jgi:hypothetical protein
MPTPRFAVEVETHMPAGYERGPHGAGVAVHWLSPGWKADADPSIVPPSSDRWGIEYVSPILEGGEGLRTLREDLTTIRNRGGQVNLSCGVHVHIDFPRNDLAAKRRLTRLVANHQTALYAVTGNRSRELGRGSRYGHHWCKPVKPLRTPAGFLRANARDRYYLVNFRTGGKPTVEFRVFSGSLDPQKVVTWVRLCVGLVERALACPRGAAWNHKAPATGAGLLKKTGLGEQEVARLLFQLGWTFNGYGTRRFGRCKFGAIDGDDLTPCVTEAMRLAQKYDAALAAEREVA